MDLLKSLANKISLMIEWILGQLRTVRGRGGASLKARLIAAITIISIVMIAVFAVKWIRSYTRATVTLATAGEGGEYCLFGKNLEKVINENQRRIRIGAKTTLGSSENMQLLEKGDVELAIVQHDTPASPSVQAVASLFPEVLHVIVEGHINSITAMKGKRIAVVPNLLGQNNDPNDPNSYCRRFIERYGMENEVEIISETNLEDASDAFLGEKVDAVVVFIAVGNDCVGKLLRQQARPVRLLPIDVNAVETWYPYVEAAVIHKAAYWGEPAIPDVEVPSVSVQALLLTHRRVHKDTIYEITRSLYEHRNKLMVENPRAATIRLPNSGDDLGIPLHAGAKAYYRREEPGFLVTYADPLALFLSMTALSVTGTWHLRMRLKTQQKSRADRYNLEILSLLEQSHRTNNIHELQELRQKLFDIFRRVLEDLDQDRISVGSFHLFSFPLEVALGAIRHHEWVLMNNSPGTEDSKEQND